MIFMTSFYRRTNNIERASALHILNKTLIPAGIILFVVLITSCSEKSTTIGSGILPGTDFVEILATDTIPVESYTMYIDSIFSTNRTYSYLGGLYDPYFGNTFTDFVSQLRVTKKYSGGEPLIDSVKLLIPILGAKGEYGYAPKVSLYEITEELSSDSLYYSNRDPHAGTFLGTYQLPAISKDTAQNFSLSMPVAVGQYLMRDTSKLNQEGGANDFRSFFKGLYVTIDPVTKSFSKGSVPLVPLMMSLSFSTGDFKIRVFYHTYLSDNLGYDFIINSNSVRYNRYLHDFSTAEPDKKIKHINDGYKDTLSYIQGFNGVFTRVKFPELALIKEKMPISVNKTKFTFTVFLDETLYTTTTVPGRIYMSYYTSSGVRSIVPDYSLSSSFFDGTFNSSSKVYNFNLASFAQEYLEGRIPLPEVDMYFPEGEVKNVILKVNNSPSPVKFQFVYTRF
jgi:hypothetical protein